MKAIAFAALLVALPFCTFAAGERPGAGPLSVYIVPNARTPQSRLLYRTVPELGVLAFDVILTNTSAKPLTIWAQGSSWSHSNISFELARAGGKRLISRRSVAWDANAPHPYTLLPKEHYVFHIRFGDETWPLDWLPEGGSKTSYTIRAIYQVESDDRAKEFHIWTGTVSSTPCDFIIAS